MSNFRHKWMSSSELWLSEKQVMSLVPKELVRHDSPFGTGRTWSLIRIRKDEFLIRPFMK